jgi:hypothetical protein
MIDSYFFINTVIAIIIKALFMFLVLLILLNIIKAILLWFDLANYYHIFKIMTIIVKKIKT